MGTQEISALYLKTLIDFQYNIIAVFTQPARKKGRGMKFQISPVQKLAEEKGIKVFAPIELDSSDINNQFENLKPDLIVVMGYGLILPKSSIGTSTDISTWLPLDSLQIIAFNTLRKSIDKNIDLNLQRIDARPEKGMIKFIFDNHYWGIQLDGATGDVLAITKRRSDFFENIHDGSILDIIFGTNGEIIKLIYISIMGISLLTFTITGFWLWYGPKLMRK